MITKVLKKDYTDLAAALLKNDELVAFPTESVYGLGGNAFSETAVKKIYAVKGRPSDNPLIIHIADTGDIDSLAIDVPDTAYILCGKLTPLTLVLKKSPHVPSFTTSGLDTIAIRKPFGKNCNIANAIIKASELFLAAPSANISGRPSPTCAEHVLDDLDGKIPLIIDGGPVEYGLESTVLDLTGPVPEILRPGAVTIDDLAQFIPQVRYSVSAEVKSPGQKYAHYAPNAPVILILPGGETNPDRVRCAVNTLVSADSQAGVIMQNPTGISAGFIIDAGKTESEYAANLFHSFRSMDKMGAKKIYVLASPDRGIGAAVNNRLKKAASQIIRL